MPDRRYKNGTKTDLLMRGAGEAAERGVLMRTTGEAFQALRRVQRVVFDKTGTLTEGHPALRQIVPLASSAQELLALAAAVEAGSEHPLARAVVDEAFNRGIALAEVGGFEAVPGKGASRHALAMRVLWLAAQPFSQRKESISWPAVRLSLNSNRRD